MFASDVVNIVGPGEEISDKDTGRTSRAIGCRDGSLAGASGGAANHDAAGRGSGDKRELWGMGTAGNAPSLICPRPNPADAVLRRAGEKTCVSWRLSN